jgi:hypothetical protein
MVPSEDERAPGGPDPASDSGDAGAGGQAERKLRDRLEGLIPDLVRKTFYAGLGAVFSTEDGVRKLVNDFSLPKDVANYLMTSAAGTKDDVLRILGREMHEFFDRLNLSQELAKLLTQLSFEIKTEIRFIPNDQAVEGQLAVKPDVKRKMSIKRSKEGGQNGAAPADATTGDENDADGIGAHVAPEPDDPDAD